MAGTSLLALLDDIATLLDDIAVMTKTATTKTAGVLGDDLALNANQLTGLRAEREIPVVWAVCKGSFFNKLILVPAALAISAFAPWAVLPLLMIGGLYLCFEGSEKVWHKLQSAAHDPAEHKAMVQAALRSAEELRAFEANKIRGAIRTDFILSAEIIVISLGTVAEADFVTRLGVLSAVAILMTVGVYGLVAGIVKLDDAGLALSQRAQPVLQALGRTLLRAAPQLMKLLSVLGTAAMFLVGGGILLHGIPPLHHGLEHLVQGLQAGPMGPLLAFCLPILANAVTGLIAGGLALLAFEGAQSLRGQKAH